MRCVLIKYKKRKKLLLGEERVGGTYIFSHNKNSDKKNSAYFARVTVQPRYLVEFSKFDRKTDKSKDTAVVSFSKKSNVNKLLKSRGFSTPREQSSFSWSDDKRFEDKKISVELNGIKFKK